MLFAHIDLAGGQSLADFGSDWLYVLLPAAGMFLVALALALYGRDGRPRPLRDFETGAAKLLGLPTWVAAPIVILTGAMLFAVVGFFWDVAWHIAIGRDEFLFSPPHVCLLFGLGLMGTAGLSGAIAATRAGADVGWRRGRIRVPYGSAVFMVSGAVAMVGFGVDELWHWAYGLDVTMWSPPHLSMIAAALSSPLAAWLLLAEAGPGAGKRLVRYGLLGLWSSATLIGLSAWQLEFDLGVPQWRQAFHPLLVVMAGGFALTAARAALGRGWAVFTMARFVVIRTLLLLLTASVWGLPQPRFVPYLGAAIAVELAFVLTRGRTPVQTALVAGVGVATLGLASAAWFTSVWSWNPWTAGLAQSWLPIAATALGAAVLGMAFGRVVSHRPSGIRAGQVAAALAAVVIAGLSLVPRTTPQASVTIRTQLAGQGLVHVEVEPHPAGAFDGAERLQVMAWQGGGLVVEPLRLVSPGRYRTTQPVPHGGRWKTMVRVAKGSDLGAIPLSMPADPEISALAVDLLPLQRTAFAAESTIMLREAHDGPTWPSIVGFGFVGLGVSAIIGLLLAGTVGLDRRRRAPGWTNTKPADGVLEGARVLLTGAAGGIGRATRQALERQGARVVGIDLCPDPVGAETIVADVRSDEDMRRAVDEAAQRMGGLDIVIANAGIGLADDSSLPPSADAHNLMQVNLFGAWRVVGESAEHLRRSTHPDGGRIVVIGSGLARANVPFAAAYTAAKRGLVGYAEVLRLELMGELSVSVVQPAYIQTAIHDVPALSGASLEGLVRVETVNDAAAAIVAACETGRRELGSSPLTSLELWFARHFPKAVDRAVAQRMRRIDRHRPRPDFSRTPQSQVVQPGSASTSEAAKVGAAEVGAAEKAHR